jgi:hypothetical protein
MESSEYMALLGEVELLQKLNWERSTCFPRKLLFKKDNEEYLDPLSGFW